MEKKWKILYSENSDKKIGNIDDVVKILLENRSLNTKSEIESFFLSDINSVSLKSSFIDKKQFERFKKRIEEAFEKSEKIIVFGDYDVDGICSSAILWETLYSKTKRVFPYIPDRVDEGYGLSKKGIDNVLVEYPDTKVIITVDNGIVAYDAVSYAKEKGIDVIVTDHHVKGKKLPDAYCILHTTSLCGAGIAWVIAKELSYESKEKVIEKLEFAALATIADLVPLVGNNRVIVKKGLEILKDTKRVGLKELLKDAGIEKNGVSVYMVGHIISPRINATGRIQSAMNALRLLCTNNPLKAKVLTSMLSDVNRDRQDLTEESVAHAKLLAIKNTYSKRITVVSDESYNQGIIGLVASHLVESYYRPSFAIAVGKEISKGSARSIKGVNIIELLRSVSDTLIEAGGHPMAAGFSIETSRIEEFTKELSYKAETVVTDEVLQRFITIDLMLPFNIIDKSLISEILKLEPCGMGNPEPVFATTGVEVLEVRKIGRDQNHLKLKLSKDGKIFDAVGFRLADKVEVSAGDHIDVAYTVDENEWNGKTTLQLKIKDLKQG